MSQTAERQDHVRIPALDGLRGIAILVVMLAHFTYMRPLAVWDVPLYTFARYGWTGVDLFFVLSGFLITGILLDAKGRSHYFRNFYIHRMLRILPLYYLFVFGLLTLYPLAGEPSWAAEAKTLRDHQWWIWLHMANWLVASTGDFWTVATLGTGGFWSISIEEQFYLVWPLLVLFLSERHLLWTCGLLCFLSLLTRLGMALDGASWAAVYTVTFGRMDSLSAGAALAVLARSPAGLGALRRYVRPTVIMSVLLFVSIEIAMRLTGYPNYILALALEITLAALLSAALLVGSVIAMPGSLWSRMTCSGVLRSFGKYSFALYLFHGHLNRWFGKFGFDIEGKGLTPILGSILPYQLLYIALGIGISYLVAFISWHLYEKHFLALKALFPSGHVSSRVPVSPALLGRGLEPAAEGYRPAQSSSP